MKTHEQVLMRTRAAFPADPGEWCPCGCTLPLVELGSDGEDRHTVIFVHLSCPELRALTKIAKGARQKKEEWLARLLRRELTP